MEEFIMGSPISNQFSNRFIAQVVNKAFDDVGAGDSIPMSKGAKNQLSFVDQNHDGRISRSELTSAMTRDGVSLSLENAGRPNYGVARAVIGFMDAADGIRGCVIRNTNANVPADQAANNLANGSWVIGKAFRTPGGPTLEIHQNADGPKITLP
jgi:hypothetical protein